MKILTTQMVDVLFKFSLVHELFSFWREIKDSRGEQENCQQKLTSS